MPAAFEGEPLEIGFNPEFLKRGDRERRGRRGDAAADLAAAAGAAAAGRQRGLPLPGDADPPQRLSPAVLVAAVEARPLRSLSGAGRARHGIVSLIGPNGAGKTNLLEALYFALTGRSFRTARPPRPDSLRRLARPRRGAGARRGRHRAPPAGLGQPRRGPPPPARRQPGRPGDAGPHRPPVAVFSPDRLALVKGPPAERRAHLDGFVAARWPSRSELRRRFGQALAQRNALIARVAAGAAAPASSTPGTRRSPRRPRRWPRPAPRRSTSWRRPSPTAAAELGLEGGGVARVRAPRRAARRRRSAPASPSAATPTCGSAAAPGARTSTS